MRSIEIMKCFMILSIVLCHFSQGLNQYDLAKDGFYYFIDQNKETWYMANKKCKLDEARLAILHHVKPFWIEKELAPKGKGPLWVGARNTGIRWEWLDGILFTEDWTNKTKQNEECVLHGKSEFLIESCLNRFLYICQRNSSRDDTKNDAALSELSIFFISFGIAVILGGAVCFSFKWYRKFRSRRKIRIVSISKVPTPKSLSERPPVMKSHNVRAPMLELRHEKALLLESHPESAPDLESHHVRAPVLGSHHGRVPVLESHHGRASVLESHHGRAPVLESHHGRAPVLELHHGRAPVLESHHGRAPVLKSHHGRAPVLESQPQRELFHGLVPVLEEHLEREPAPTRTSIQRLTDPLVERDRRIARAYHLARYAEQQSRGPVTRPRFLDPDFTDSEPDSDDSSSNDEREENSSSISSSSSDDSDDEDSSDSEDEGFVDLDEELPQPAPSSAELRPEMTHRAPISYGRSFTNLPGSHSQAFHVFVSSPRFQNPTQSACPGDMYTPVVPFEPPSPSPSSYVYIIDPLDQQSSSTSETSFSSLRYRPDVEYPLRSRPVQSELDSTESESEEVVSIFVRSASSQSTSNLQEPMSISAQPQTSSSSRARLTSAWTMEYSSQPTSTFSELQPFSLPPPTTMPQQSPSPEPTPSPPLSD